MTSQCSAWNKLVMKSHFLNMCMFFIMIGRLSIQTHWKHINQLLGMNVKTQNKKGPTHSGIDREDTTDDLSSDVATTFRTCVGILMYLANDMPHCQYVI